MRNTNTLALEGQLPYGRPAAAPRSTIAYHGAWSLRAACLAIGASVAALALLASLHLLSPEFNPSWRMVSEYALGRYGWVLSLMFLCWGLSSCALGVALWHLTHARRGQIGLWLLLLAGVGEAMAAVFDISHDLDHSVAGILGMGGFPIAAVLVSVSLDQLEGFAAGRRLRRNLAYLACVCPVLLIATTVLMAAQLAQVNGGQLPDHAPAILPAGVIGLDGWTDRLLVVSFCTWQITLGWHAVRNSRRWRADARRE